MLGFFRAYKTTNLLAFIYIINNKGDSMDKKKKKGKAIFKFKVLFLLIIAITSFVYTIKFLDKINLKVDDLFLSSLVSKSTNLKGDGISSTVVNYVIDLDFLKPIHLLSNNYKGLVDKPNVLEKTSTIAKEETPKEEKPVVKPTVKDPIVYIYNTHQSEEYASKNAASYNIKPTVLVASYMLQEKLKKQGISSIVEESNILELLRINNWNYASSYKITRMLMEQAKKDYPSLVYFIDLHRDSIERDKTTITIGDKTYAKVLFLLGLEHEKSDESKKVISRVNTIISEKYPGLSKGIYEKGGKGVNGIYNQDFSSNCILIEVGGVDNTIEEVSNTIDAITDMLTTYIGEVNG